MKPYYPLLLKTALFEGISADDLDTLHRCLNFQVQKYQKDEAIFLESDVITKFGIVLSGNIIIVKDDVYGKRSIISNIIPGNLFGEAFALSHQKMSSVSAYAASKSEILFLDAGKILTLCEALCPFHTRLVHNIMRVIAEKNIFLNEKIDLLSQKKIRDKLLSFLNSEAKRQKSLDFQIAFDRQQLADYLFIDRSALSAELSKLQQDGYLTYHKNHFTLKSWANLTSVT